jgi:hypothetical protein
MNFVGGHLIREQHLHPPAGATDRWYRTPTSHPPFASLAPSVNQAASRTFGQLHSASLGRFDLANSSSYLDRTDMRTIRLQTPVQGRTRPASTQHQSTATLSVCRQLSLADMPFVTQLRLEQGPSFRAAQRGGFTIVDTASHVPSRSIDGIDGHMNTAQLHAHRTPPSPTMD